MLISIDQRQAEVLQEILHSQLRDLRFDAARADIRDYRRILAERERVVEALLAKLAVEESQAAKSAG